MAYRGITLDFYGTLVHEDDQIVAEICDRIVRMSNFAHHRQVVGNNWWGKFCELAANSYNNTFVSQRQIAFQSLIETTAHFEANLDVHLATEEQFAQWKAPELFPETVSFVDWLASTGLPVCIVSNIDRDDIEAAMRFNGLNFTNIITSDDVRAYKPRKEIFSAALEKLNLQPREILHIGDSRTSDVVGANASGIPVAWLNRSGKASMFEQAPTHIIRNLREAVDLFR